MHMYIYWHTGLQVTCTRAGEFVLDEAKALHDAGLLVYGIWTEACDDEGAWLAGAPRRLRGVRASGRLDEPAG